MKISPEKCNLNLTKMIWTHKNNLDPTKIIWTVQNHFGPIKGQDIHQLLLELTHRTTFAISIRLLIIFYYFGVGILKTKKNWKIEWKIERKKKQISSQSYEKWKKYYLPHPSLKAPYPPTTLLLNEFKVSLLFRYSLTNCLFYLDKKKVARWFLLKV